MIRMFRLTSDRSRRVGSADLVAVAINMVIRAATLSSRFLLVVVFARLLRPADIGIYGLVVSAVALSIFFVGLEYYWFTMRVLPTQSRGAQAVVLRDQLVLHGAAYAVMLPVLAVLFSPVLPASALGWFLALVMFEHLSQESTRALIALGRPVQANVVLFIRTGAWAFPLLGLAAIDARFRVLPAVFTAWFIGVVASLAAAAWQMRDLDWRYARQRPVDWKGVREGLRVSAPYFVTTGSTMALIYVDRFLIMAFQGLEAVGVYTFFAGMATGLHQLVNTSVSLNRVPHLVRALQGDDRVAFHRELWGGARVTIWATLVLAAVASAAIVPALGFVGRSVYRDQAGIFFLLLAAACIRSFADVPMYALYASSHDSAVVFVNLAGGATSVLLNLLLVPRLSTQGAGIAAVISSAVLLVGGLVGVFLYSSASFGGSRALVDRLGAVGKL